MQCSAQIFENLLQLYLPPASAVEVIESVPCFRLSIFPSFRLSVCECSHGWTIWRTDPKIGIRVDLDEISAKFDSQGHRSKVKVTRLENVISRVFWSGWPDTKSWCMMLHHDSVTSWRDVMSRHDITMSCDVSPNDVSRAKGLQNACRGRCVNAGAFSFRLSLIRHSSSVVVKY